MSMLLILAITIAMLFAVEANDKRKKENNKG